MPLNTAAILLSGFRQVYVLTVIGPTGNGSGLALRGLFVGDDEECFKAASKLSLEVNFTLVPRPIQKVRFVAIMDVEKHDWGVCFCEDSRAVTFVPIYGLISCIYSVC